MGMCQGNVEKGRKKEPTILLENVDPGGDCTCGDRSYMGISVPSSQCCRGPKTDLKNCLNKKVLEEDNT